MSLKRSRILKVRRSDSLKNPSGEPYVDGFVSKLFPPLELVCKQPTPQ